MATIGPNNPLQSSAFSAPMTSSPSVSNLGFTAAATPAGLNYGSRVMSEVDIIAALMKLLEQGQSAPTGTGAGATGSPGLQGAAGKGGGLKMAAGKGGGGGKALQAAPGKPGGGGMALKQAAGKTA